MSNNSQVDKCLVCGKKKQHGRVLQFFKFPYDIERCKSWVKAIGMRELLFMPLEILREQVVCMDHFDLGCIRFNRLHRTALPSNTPYLPLCDEDTSDFPKRRISKEPGHTDKFNSSYRQERKRDNPTATSELEFVIDYERPLMESLGTLVHNDRHAVQKPAGILNSIAVPLMTYSSSLEKGTVFAAADPGKKYDLPFVPFIESTSQNECTTNKRYTNVKAVNRNFTHIPAAPNLESTMNVFIKPMDPIQKNTLVGKVKPNIKTIDRVPKSQRNYNVSFGLNTLITGNPRKANKDPNVTVSEGPRKMSIKAPEDRYKNIKQYTNNRLTIHSIKKNIPIIQNEIAAQGTTASLPEEDQLQHVENTNKPIDAIHTSEYVTLVSNTSAVYKHEVPADYVDANDNSANNNSLDTLESKSESTSSDLTFVPYSQYTATVTPESPNAHTAEGTMDYGLPLMNCIGTVFQETGNIHSTVNKTKKTEDVIDIPLMMCLKTLEHTSTL